MSCAVCTKKEQGGLEHVINGKAHLGAFLLLGSGFVGCFEAGALLVKSADTRCT